MKLRTEIHIPYGPIKVFLGKEHVATLERALIMGPYQVETHIKELGDLFDGDAYDYVAVEQAILERLGVEVTEKNTYLVGYVFRL